MLKNSRAKKNLLAACTGLLVAISAAGTGLAQNQPKSLDALLNQVKTGWNADRAENRKRVAEFKASRDRQSSLLSSARAKFKALEAESAALETKFTDNEGAITKQEETLRLRLGTMGELFGVIRQSAGDAQAELKSSLVSAQYPGREKLLIQLATSKELPRVAELEGLWFAFQQEMIEQGKVAQFKATVTDAAGGKTERDVVRVGVFNAVSEGKYLDWLPEVGNLVELSPQPQGRHQAGAVALQNGVDGSEWASFGVDFTRGAILRALVQAPSTEDRIKQGGYIGGIIIALGILTVIFSLVRFVQLALIGMAVRKQRGNLQKPSSSNPLGRILALYTAGKDIDAKSLEHKLDEAVMRESTQLESFLWAVKVVSGVAPLLGLLGTVTGMIRTFQSITLFGTGDPKRMAGGISEALVTTMLGLIVAITVLFLYSWLKTLSRRVIEILDEQSAGLVAQKHEAEERRGRSVSATV